MKRVASIAVLACLLGPVLFAQQKSDERDERREDSPQSTLTITRVTVDASYLYITGTNVGEAPVGKIGRAHV